MYGFESGVIIDEYEGVLVSPMHGADKRAGNVGVDLTSGVRGAGVAAVVSAAGERRGCVGRDGR
eukprot:4728461-Pleurochrysis_carterae.AAC.1